MPDHPAPYAAPHGCDCSSRDLGVRAEVARVLSHAALHHRPVVIARTPKMLSRITLYQALDAHFGRWLAEPGGTGAFIDLSNHPAVPAQTVIGSDVQTWDDLAEGLPDALAPANMLVVAGLEQMLVDTPHRLAAFLQSRARRQVVVVLTPLADQVRALQIREAPVYLDCSLARQVTLLLIAKSTARMAIADAKRAARAAAQAHVRRRP
jgi:hypothetical protein